jgi:hypothetical protein
MSEKRRNGVATSSPYPFSKTFRAYSTNFRYPSASAGLRARICSTIASASPT